MQRHPDKPCSYRYRVGKAEVIVLADGYRSFPFPDGFVANADRSAINAALADVGLPQDQMLIHFNPIALKIDGRTYLVDTGNGLKAAAEPGSTRGWTVASMETAGLKPGDIDTVIISHFHGDHVSGLLDATDQPTFPNANIIVPQREWDFWMGEALADEGPAKSNAEMVRGILDPLMSRITKYDWDDDIAPGLTAVGTPGHTPGHTSFMLASESERVFIQSDVTNNPALFARNPGWKLTFDMDGDLAVKTRRKVYDMLADENLPVQGFHYPFPSKAQVQKDGDGYQFQVVEDS